MEPVHLNPHQAMNVLLTFVPRTLNILMWLIFATFHLSLVAILLLLLWVFQVSPRDISEWVRLALRTDTAQGAVAVLGVLGLSGLAVFVAYVRFWRTLYARWSASFLTQGL
jgi:hypothetical protein